MDAQIQMKKLNVVKGNGQHCIAASGPDLVTSARVKHAGHHVTLAPGEWHKL